VSGFAVNTFNFNWRIADGSTSKQPLQFFEGFSLLNPLHYARAYKKQGFIVGTPSKTGRDNFIDTKGLLLESQSPTDRTAIDLFKKLPQLFRQLRYQSLQSQIKVNNYISVIMPVSEQELASGRIKPEIRSLVYYNSYYYHSMLTWKHVRQAERELASGSIIPVYEEIVIDAFDAVRNQEHSKTILFSAIAIEAMLANKYDELHGKSKRNKKQDKRYPQNYVATDDAIYKVLKDGPFKRMLHEIPLYVLNRSIMMENPKLYQSLLKLYNTRNKIVHFGTPADPENGKLLPISEQGARTAFSLLLDTFEWMRINRFSVLRNNKHIEIK